MANQRLFDLPETKGSFQVKGLVNGMEKNNAFKETTTKTNKSMRLLNFGIMYQDKSTVYVNLNGMERDYVYFYKKAEKKGEKGSVEKVNWEDRFAFNRDGYRMIGINVGVKKIVDTSGKVVNDKKLLTDYDACKEIYTNLKDDNSVFVRGNLDYSSYIDNNGNKRNSVKLVPTQVSLCQDVDFTDEDYDQINDFNQVIVFMNIDKEKDDNGVTTNRFIVEAKIVTYSTIENMNFIIENPKLANMFKKNLKPYYAIKVSGHIVASVQTEVVQDEDEWGEKDQMEFVTAPVRREFIITGAKGSSIETEIYSQKNMEDAIRKINDAHKAETVYEAGENEDGWGEDDFMSVDLNDDALPFD